MDVRVGKKERVLSAEELMLLNCGAGEDSWESLGLQGDPTSPSWRKSVLNINWKDWCWSWNSNTVATWCKELTHWKRPWCWERLRAGGEGTVEDEKVGWHHRLNGHGFGWTLGVGQGGLECCGSQDHKEPDTTEWLNWTELSAWKPSCWLSVFIYLFIYLLWNDIHFILFSYLAGNAMNLFHFILLYFH